MKYVPMNIIEYRFDEEGNTEQVVVGFQTYSGPDSFSARLNISIDDIKASNPAWTFANLTQDRAELVARRKLRDWVMLERPEEPEEPETEGPVD